MKHIINYLKEALINHKIDYNTDIDTLKTKRSLERDNLTIKTIEYNYIDIWDNFKCIYNEIQRVIDFIEYFTNNSNNKVLIKFGLVNHLVLGCYIRVNNKYIGRFFILTPTIGKNPKTRIYFKLKGSNKALYLDDDSDCNEILKNLSN